MTAFTARLYRYPSMSRGCKHRTGYAASKRLLSAHPQYLLLFCCSDLLLFCCSKLACPLAGNILFAALLLAVGFVAYKLFGLLGAHCFSSFPARHDSNCKVEMPRVTAMRRFTKWTAIFNQHNGRLNRR